MKRITFLVLVGLLGCGGASTDETPLGDETPEANAARLAKAIYVAPPGASTPRGDYLPAMSVGIDATRPTGATPANTVRFLYDYPGSPTRVTGACLGDWQLNRGGALTFNCAGSSLLAFTLVRSDAKGVELKNAKGESFTLDRVDPEAKADVRAECDAGPVTLRVDLTRLATARRAVFHVTPKPNVFHGQSPQGIFALTSPAGAGAQMTLEGTDFYEGQVSIKLPRDPAGSFTGSLRYYDAGGPFASTPKTYPLSCRVTSP
jgi:hypothetical protein